ncbi:protein of unknown function (plasmid) [Cupriavidus neocaledonicus]|uniref:Uncharacterized protein n=1 Tax=Cupriavidus neocaledonicus TaxID=1040979 RepID=A0A375HNN5_9BURK|nr:protein of unknown function [Cupriavidus neocaledonicus]
MGFRPFQLCLASSFLRISFCWLHRFLSFLHLSRAHGPTLKSHKVNKWPGVPGRLIQQEIRYDQHDGG